MKKSFSVVSAVLFFILMFSSCSKGVEVKSKSFYTYFDTVITVYSYAGESESRFEKNCKEIEQLFERYNKLFDIYREYSGVNNLCTVNLSAGKPVVVDSEIIELLQYSMKMYNLTEGEMNIMMGSVLKLWNNGVPSSEELNEAYEHCGIDSLMIDESAGTVTITDSLASLDVGAVAKGFATEKVAKYLKQKGIEGYVINAGGNVRLIGEKPESVDWKIAIKNPQDKESVSAVFALHDTSCVTSGSYERFHEIDGTKYSHIIDKDTLSPASFFESVSVVCSDSAYADSLSTALFCMSYDQGLELYGQLGDFEVFWIFHDGSCCCTEGLKKNEV